MSRSELSWRVVKSFDALYLLHKKISSLLSKDITNGMLCKFPEDKMKSWLAAAAGNGPGSDQKRNQRMKG